MGRYANPFDEGEQGAERYVRAMLERLGGRDPLQVLSEGPDRLRALVEPLAARIRTWRPEPAAWCIDEVVVHLADAEIVYAYRYRAVLGGNDPDVPGFDQDRWAREMRYATQEAGAALELFGALRRANVALLGAVPPGGWARSGRHERRGREPLRRIVELAAAHDLVHAAQIARRRDAAEGRMD